MAKILAVDSEQDELIVISDLLKDLMPDCRLITAESGDEGIEKAKAESPDAILLDTKRSKMDGLEVCRALRSSEDTRRIPIIMLVENMMPSRERIRALEAGADAFLSRPIDDAELVAQVARDAYSILTKKHGYIKRPELTQEQLSNERLTFPYADEPETIDEIVLYNASVHLKQLDDQCYMLIVSNDRHYWHTVIHSKGRRDKVIATLYEDNSPQAQLAHDLNTIGDSQ